MKIALGSDLHLEFGTLDVIENREAAEVLVLSGDILVADHFRDTDLVDRAAEYHEFFSRCTEAFGDVVYIMGNHEHYDGNFAHTAALLRRELSQHPNVHVLDNETWQSDSVVFVGTTLWTDCNGGDPITQWELQRGMNDYRVIANGDAPRLLIEDTVAAHRAALAFVDAATQDATGRYVVVGHHAPSRQSIKPRYRADHHMNGGYSSDLEAFVTARPQIGLWTHGHTHDDFDYRVGTTRVVCNPRGYKGYESRAENWDFVYIDV